MWAIDGEGWRSVEFVPTITWTKTWILLSGLRAINKGMIFLFL